MLTINGKAVTKGLPQSDGAPGDIIVQTGTTLPEWRVNGGDQFHGIESAGALTFDNATQVLTMASGGNTYWWKGNRYSTTAALLCDLSSVDDRDPSCTEAPLQANTLYFVYFIDATGQMYWSTDFFNLFDQAPVATVYWNGSAGAVGRETHGHKRDIDWHYNAHLTIGARYYNGLGLTAPVSGIATTMDIDGGTMYDEDIAYVIPPQTNCRIWHLNSAGTAYTFYDNDRIYANVGVTDAAQFYNTSTGLLAPVGNNDYVCSWVYASGDTERSIYVVPSALAGSAHNTVAIARNEPPPVLAGFDLTPELRLLYRLIIKNDGTVMEYADYRTVSSLPSGFIASTNAASVSFVNTDTALTATNVQDALVEIDARLTAGLL